jgi:hypothetical protein
MTQTPKGKTPMPIAPSWQAQHTAAHATATAAVESLEFILRTTFLRPMTTETIKRVIAHDREMLARFRREPLAGQIEIMRDLAAARQDCASTTMRDASLPSGGGALSPRFGVALGRS